MTTPGGAGLDVHDVTAKVIKGARDPFFAPSTYPHISSCLLMSNTTEYTAAHDKGYLYIVAYA